MSHVLSARLNGPKRAVTAILNARLIPIIEGAGGIITNWDGGSAASGGRIIAAGDRRIHEAALAMLNG
jgi:fructose-1,6-bisphosphatase/inositol monophosphatase family enzyme